MQEPEEIRVGEPYHVPRFSGPKRRLVEVFDTYQYVPLLKSLIKLLSDDSILEQIEQCPYRMHNDG